MKRPKELVEMRKRYDYSFWERKLREGAKLITEEFED